MFHAPQQEPLVVPAVPAPADDPDRSIGLLRTACDNRAVHKALERLLTQPAEQRKALVHAWVSDMLANKASGDFVHAVASLQEDGVADKAYAMLFGHQREALLARLRPQY